MWFVKKLKHLKWLVVSILVLQLMMRTCGGGHYALEYSNVCIANKINIDASTVSRILALFEETGDVKKRPHPCGQAHHQQKLTAIDQLFVIEVVLERPGVYLHELQQLLLEETGTCFTINYM